MDPIARLIRNPLVLLAWGGEVTEMNPAAERLLGGRRSRWNEVFADPGALRALLVNASGSSDPVIGALEVLSPGGVRRLQVQALAMRQGEAAYAVELRETTDDQFSLLTDRVRSLNAEIAVRRRAQAQLEEALRRNRVLYRELQHRVKNHLQMILALVSAAGRESAEPANKAFVAMLQAKLSALFDAQRLMYLDDAAGGVRADQMLNSIAGTVQTLAQARALIRVDAEELIVPNDIAFPVALIANELLTNAAKHGASREGAEIRLGLRREGGEVVLEVADDGPGFSPGAPKSAASGLGLVRGLCRQIGGRLDVRSDRGVRALVTFPVPEALHAVA